MVADGSRPRNVLEMYLAGDLPYRFYILQRGPGYVCNVETFECVADIKDDFGARLHAQPMTKKEVLRALGVRPYSPHLWVRLRDIEIIPVKFDDPPWFPRVRKFFLGLKRMFIPRHHLREGAKMDDETPLVSIGPSGLGGQYNRDYYAEVTDGG